jgi:aminoglycoside phosphotransferase (APT) family kinase protein
MKPSNALDLAALQTWLQQQLPDFAGPLTATPLQAGQSNPTWLLASPQVRWVMRAKPAPTARLLPSAHAIEREFRVMQALQGSAVPVPHVTVLCEDESVIGVTFYLMEFVDGRILRDATLPGLTPGARTALYDEANRVIATLHRLDWQAAGLADHGRPGNYFERQIKRWRAQSLASQTTPIPAMERLMAWLPDNIPAQARNAADVSLVHGDFRVDNLVFHPGEPRVLAVLDWELSTLGHPLGDLAYHCMAWHIAPGVLYGFAGQDLAALGLPDERSYITTYCQRAGRNDLEAVLAHWNFYLACNFFRLAAILQGIARRVHEGTAANPNAVQAAQMAAPMAELGWQIASAPAGTLWSP